MNTANIITISRILTVPVFVYFLYNSDKPYFGLISAVLFLLISLTDWVDGYIARKYNQVTDFGKFLDPLADKILVSSAMIILVGIGRLNSIACVVVIFREFIVTSLRLVANTGGKVIAASIWGKLKTVSQITAVMVILLEEYLVMLYPLPYSAFFVWIMVILTIYSGLEYMWQYKDYIKYK